MLNFTLMLHGDNFDKLCNTQCCLKACVLWAAEKGHPPAEPLEIK